MKPIPLNAPTTLDVSDTSRQNLRGGQVEPNCDFASQLASSSEESKQEQGEPTEFVGLVTPPLDEPPKANVEPVGQSGAEIDNALTAVMNQCQILSDEKGQKLVLMTMQIPGRGDVRVRVWKRKNGIDIRFKSADPTIATSLRNRQAELEHNLRARGVRLSQVIIT